MITTKIIGFSDIKKDTAYTEMLDEMRDDRISIEEIEECLVKPMVDIVGVYKDDKYVGFYTQEAGYMPEIHLYITKPHRTLSMEIMRHILRNTPRPFVTSVYGPYKHVYQILKRFGFEDLINFKDTYIKDGKPHDIIFLVKR